MVDGMEMEGGEIRASSRGAPFLTSVRKWREVVIGDKRRRSGKNGGKQWSARSSRQNIQYPYSLLIQADAVDAAATTCTW